MPLNVNGTYESDYSNNAEGVKRQDRASNKKISENTEGGKSEEREAQLVRVASIEVRRWVKIYRESIPRDKQKKKENLFLGEHFEETG